MKKTEFRDIVLKKIEEKIDDCFVEINEIAGTKSGDIAPEQALDLRQLTNELVDLMVEQVMQNNPANVTYPVAITRYGIAVRIQDGYLQQTTSFHFDERVFSENDEHWTNVKTKDIVIKFINDVYEETGWIYIKDYKLETAHYKIRFDEK